MVQEPGMEEIGARSANPVKAFIRERSVQPTRFSRSYVFANELVDNASQGWHLRQWGSKDPPLPTLHHGWRPEGRSRQC